MSPPSQRRPQSVPAELPGASALTMVVTGVVIVAALSVAREVLIPITVAVLLSFVLAPLVGLLRRARLGRVPAVTLVSLQKHDGIAQLADLPTGMTVETLGDDFDAGPDAFLDAAAVMMTLDLVISSDTAMAHLAGALARPVWIPLKQVPDWRWMARREDTPWYPTARLFRQSRRDDRSWRSRDCER